MDNRKQIKIIFFACLGGLVALGILVSILEAVKKNKTATQSSEQKINLIENLNQISSSQMGFIFYLDTNTNNQFDYQETVFKDVGVAVRRPGEERPFATIPAEASGIVRISGLSPAKYEIQYLNAELEQPYEIGQFSLKRFYQIIEEGKVRYSFLPSDWKMVELTAEGYKAKVGLKEYQPESVLVVQSGKQLKFYEPVRFKVLGESRMVDNPIQFDLQQKLVYFLDNEAIKQFDFIGRLETVKWDRVWRIKAGSHWLAEAANALVYLDQQGSWQFQKATGGCRTNLETKDYQDLTATESLPKVSFNQLGKAVMTAKTKSQASEVYLAECTDKDKLVVSSLNLGQVNSLAWLDSQTIFYSTGTASYFYNLETKQATQYTALTGADEVVFSQDRKYLSARLNGSTMIVDYPAVKASGVEKHYLLPYIGQVAFSGDQVLINQSKPCLADGDCGEIIRISLLGNGVWELADRIELKDIQADKVLGEIRLN